MVSLLLWFWKRKRKSPKAKKQPPSKSGMLRITQVSQQIFQFPVIHYVKDNIIIRAVVALVVRRRTVTVHNFPT